MPKSCRTYWNPLVPENARLWTAVEGSNGKVEFTTLPLTTGPGIIPD
jgi:hypothetical protein